MLVTFGIYLERGKIMKKIFLIIFVVGLLFYVSACSSGSKSAVAETYHGVSFEIPSKWVEGKKSSKMDEIYVGYALDDTKTDTLWTWYVGTELEVADLVIGGADDNTTELLPLDDDSEIQNYEIKRINGDDILIVDSKGLNGLTIQRLAVVNAEGGLVIIAHNYDFDQTEPFTKEFEKVINSIKSAK